MVASTRGDLAYALYNALGISEPSSSGKFGDSGYLDAVTSTLADLGITNGIGGGNFGTMQPTTRGQAFTMMARALGLADASSSIEEASAALVAAGIVKGYNNDPNDLRLDAPLEKEHLGLLIGRIAPVLTTPDDDGHTRQDDLNDMADAAREVALGKQDPRYAAYLAQLGVRKGEVDDEIKLRNDLFLEDQRLRSESYARATEQAMSGIRTDFENRGLFRSGTRLKSQADKTTAIGHELTAAETAAERAHQERLRALEAERNAIDRETAMERTDAEVRVEEANIAGNN